ncbi:MAG: hypothetical protein M1814_005181 [Vezdaea aestivalis]|nr:MAG: hypothetical protein M1814_005181 [Vezdaea aestivalis]
MGYFTKIRQSKEFARQKKAEDKTKSVEPAAPTQRYRHVPRHARVDAENATALYHSEEEKLRITTNAKRRSQMLFSSRSNSGYSTPTLTRPSSYQDGFGWNERGDINVRPGARRINSTQSRQTRFYVSNEPLPADYNSMINTASTSAEPSPTESSRNSLKSNSSSQEYLEMRRPRHIEGPLNENEVLEQLHRAPYHPPGPSQPDPRHVSIVASPTQEAPAPVPVSAPVAPVKRGRFSWRRSSKE